MRKRRESAEDAPADARRASRSARRTNVYLGAFPR